MTHPVGGPGAPGSAQDLQLFEESATGRSFRDVLKDAAQSIDQGRHSLERAVRAGRSGRTLSQEQLLALQATVYQYTQELEIASKLVDKATSAVRTTLQSQQ